MAKGKKYSLWERVKYHNDRATNPYHYNLETKQGKNGKWNYSMGFRDAFYGYDTNLKGSVHWAPEERRAFMWGYRRGEKVRKEYPKV